MTLERQNARVRLSLAVKFAIAFVAVLAPVLIANGLFNTWIGYNEAKNATFQLQQEKAKAAADRVSEFVSLIEGQLGWTTRPDWSRVGIEQQRYDFIRLMRQTPAITDLLYVNGAGKEQLRLSRLDPDSVGTQADLSADPRFVKTRAEKTWFGPVYLRRGSEPYMSMGVAHAGRDGGATLAEVNLKLVWDVVNSIRVGKSGYAYIVTNEGRLLAHPDMSRVLRGTDLSQLPVVADAMRRPPGAVETARVEAGMDSAQELTAYAWVPRLNWLVFVASPVSEAMEPVYASVKQAAASLLIGLLLAGVAATLIARRMVVPIRRLQEGAEKLGEGDLAQRIDIQTGDEIEQLASRFNQMATRIQDSYESLEAKVDERTMALSKSLKDLREAQDRLVQTEKLASLGQLTAGIAHEIKNPLNFVNNFSAISTELLEELRGVLEKLERTGPDAEEVDELLDMLKGNLEKIVQHGKRADSIVKNMLLHSREGGSDLREIAINPLVEESLNLAYHGARAEKPGLQIEMHRNLDPEVGDARIHPQEVTRVLLNLITNGFYAATAKAAEHPSGGPATMTVETQSLGDRIAIRIRDNGAGIPEDIRNRIFLPFFTTKPAGEGTGLGLSIAHDIVVKQHGGELLVESEPGLYTQFTVILPRKTAGG